MLLPRRRALLVLGLLCSHSLVGVLVAYFTINVPSCALGRWPADERHQRDLSHPVDLPMNKFLQPTVNTRTKCPYTSEPHIDDPTVFVITPTYKRLTQKVDLTTLCQTLSLAGRVTWLLIEDSERKTPLVTNLLASCPVKSVHLAVRSPRRHQKKRWWQKIFGRGGPPHHRGVAQRNVALKWLRENHSTEKCSGIVYFADDDNRYDLRLFDLIRKTVRVSVWPVGLAGGLTYEGPVCFNDSIHKWKTWRTAFFPEREFPLDMAGYAISLCELIKKGNVQFDSQWKSGNLESEFLKQFVSNRDQVECRGSDKMVHVWHVKTAKPRLEFEYKGYSRAEHILEI